MGKRKARIVREIEMFILGYLLFEIRFSSFTILSNFVGERILPEKKGQEKKSQAKRCQDRRKGGVDLSKWAGK